MRTAEERERLRKHFRRHGRERARRIDDIDSIHSEGTNSTAQTNGTDESWRPQKRLKKAVREQLMAGLM
jgi:hypothetical protein